MISDIDHRENILNLLKGLSISEMNNLLEGQKLFLYIGKYLYTFELRIDGINTKKIKKYSDLRGILNENKKDFLIEFTTIGDIEEELKNYS